MRYKQWKQTGCMDRQQMRASKKIKIRKRGGEELSKSDGHTRFCPPLQLDNCAKYWAVYRKQDVRNI